MCVCALRFCVELLSLHLQIVSCRLGNRKKRIGITMVRDFAPAYHLLKAPLRERLGIPGGTRGYILRKFKAYVQEHSSPNQVDPCVLRPDGDLKSLLREEGSIDISSLGDRLQPFLVPRDPVSLHYVVQLDGPSPANVDCYDVEVAWNLRPALLRLPPFLDHLNPAHPLEALDQNIAGGCLSSQCQMCTCLRWPCFRELIVSCHNAARSKGTLSLCILFLVPLLGHENMLVPLLCRGTACAEVSREQKTHSHGLRNRSRLVHSSADCTLCPRSA